MADFVQTLAVPPQVHWIIGHVTAITGATITISCNGGEVPDVTPLKQYTPVVGDVVQMLSDESRGIIAIGSVPPAAPRPEPPPTGVELILTPTIVATHGPLPGQWELGTVVQAPGRVGCWFYSQLALAPAGGMALASVSIEVTLDSAGGPPEFVEHAGTEPVGELPVLTEIPFGVQPGPVGVPTWLDLPLEWGADLIAGTAHGIGIASALFTGTYTSSTGRLKLTPV